MAQHDRWKDCELPRIARTGWTSAAHASSQRVAVRRERPPWAMPPWVRDLADEAPRRLQAVSTPAVTSGYGHRAPMLLTPRL
eukprot:532246-Amphidinium_carterae.1